jgi:gliding motility-associated-like protein
MNLFKRVISITTLFLAYIAGNSQSYVMGNLGSVSTCTGTFYDSGGSGGSYGNSENFTVTFCSSSGLDLYFVFSQFKLESNYDSLYIYNGSSTAAPLIGGYSGTNTPGTVQSSNPSDCLTFRFKSDGSVTYLGWEAAIGCGTPPPPPPPASGTTCAAAQPFCSGTAYNFPAATNTTAQVGPDYSCVLTQPNPVWYYLQIDSPGNLDITLSNTANVDVDFVCWGPFSTSSSCGSLTAANVVDCSYSTAATENINIPAAQTGEFYTLCITNFSNSPTNFTLSTDNSSIANTNCNILCNISAMTATPGLCDTATNQYTTSGSVTLQYPPTPNDTLTITTSLGDTIVIYNPTTSPISYTLPAHQSNGASVSVRAQFALDTSCHFTTTYAAPQSCVCSVNASNSSPTCTGDSVNLLITTNGNITIYQWTGPNGYTSNLAQPTIYNAAAADTGLYTITITAGTCTATDTTRVRLFASPVFGAPTITNATCTSGGSITVTATGGVGALSYLWSNNATGATNSNLAAGPYYVTVTDQNGCTTSATYTVVADPGAISFNAPAITDVTCSGAANGSITISATGGTGTLGYLWSTTPPQTGTTISAVAGGAYSVTAADQNGCSASVTYVVNEPTAIVFAAPVITNYSCTAGGSITVDASGGTGTITYTWSGGQNGATVSNLNPGSYTVTATDQNACTASASYTVGSAANVVVLNVPTIVNVSCAGGADGSITANVTGGNGVYTYAWANSAQTTATRSGLIAGQYTVSVSDGTGCSASASYTVTQPTALVIDSAHVQNIGCSGGPGSIAAYVSGATSPYIYNWVQQSNSQVYSGQTINGLQADNYSLTVTDSKGCTATAAYIVTAATPIAYTQSQTNVSCFGGNNGSATVTVTSGTPPYQFSWNGTATAGNATINGLSAGVTNVTITDANCSATATFTLTEPAQLQISLLNKTDVACNGGTNGAIAVDATGGAGPYNYAWNSNPVQTAAFATNLPAGLFTVVVTDANLCTANQTYTVTEPTALAVVLAPVNATCYQTPNGSIAATPAGGTQPYYYAWSDGNAQTTQTAVNLLAGSYSVSLTDANGCSVTASETISEPTDITVTTSVTAVKCVGDANGTITADAQGGTPPFTYTATQDNVNFSNAANSVISGLAIGTYSVIATDNNGCTQTVFATIPNAVVDNFTTSTDSTSCYGSDYNDGAAHITPLTLQNAPFQYILDGGISQISGDFLDISAGPHVITATSINGCVSQIPVLVLEPQPIVVDVVPDTVVLPLGEGQQVQVTYLNAPGVVTYSWTPVLGLSCTDCPNPTVSPFTKQDYVITISMENGSATCYGSATLHADVSEPLPVYIPNSFTPNGDGNNDLFQLYGQSIKTVDLKIFNRWGELVYQTNSQFSGWDGTYKGQLQLPQVFTYAVNVTFLNDKKFDARGTITLVR